MEAREEMNPKVPKLFIELKRLAEETYTIEPNPTRLLVNCVDEIYVADPNPVTVLGRTPSSVL